MTNISNGLLVSGRTCRQLAYLTFLPDFRERSFEKLEHLGDTAMDTQQYGVAISLYSTTLSLHPPFPKDIHIKRSKAFLAIKSWKEALDDATQVHYIFIVHVNLQVDSDV